MRKNKKNRLAGCIALAFCIAAALCTGSVADAHAAAGPEPASEEAQENDSGQKE